MEKIWVLVADANRARYFETDSPTGDLRETTDMVHPESRLHERAIRTDKPGRAFDRSGQGRHALSEQESIREQSAIAFAIEIADHLDNARTKHSFDRLIVVAPPKFLGELRERLDTTCGSDHPGTRQGSGPYRESRRDPNSPARAAVTSGGGDDSPVPLQQRLRFLREPSSFPDGKADFRVVETHTSSVYLCGDRVYKLKKPLRYSYLDFTTVEARRLNCEAELRLNRRLAPDIYLEVIPLTVNSDGAPCLSGSGPVADWLVKMRACRRTGNSSVCSAGAT